MLKLKKVAVTGGLAAGKTTVCRFFSQLGAYVVSADEITHELLSPETSVGQQVIRLLGSEIISDHSLNRKKIAEVVFSQPKLLQALEELIHPAVFDEIEKQYQDAQNSGKYPLFIAEIPLLYESEKEHHFDATIAVAATEQTCRTRFQLKTSDPLDAFDQRMNKQIDPQKKAGNADYLLQNNGDLTQLKEQVSTLFYQLIKE